jgi:hypothetical protein
MFGVLIDAVIGRLFWPVLPQRILRDDLLDLLAALKALMSAKLPIDPRTPSVRIPFPADDRTIFTHKVFGPRALLYEAQ